MKKLLLLTTILIYVSLYKVKGVDMLNEFTTSNQNTKDVKLVNGSYPERTNVKMSKSQTFGNIRVQFEVRVNQKKTE